MLPREKVPSYEIKTACSSCTNCFQWSSESGNREMIDEKERCEAIGCCKWEEGKVWGGYCNAAKTGLCTAESTHTGGASSRIDGDTELSPQSGISCKVEPGMPVSSVPHVRQIIHICIYIYVYIYIHIYIYVCVYIYTYMCIHLCIHICICVHAH